ncbi:unnamed protein product [Paramecium pentaurelia]|uniref:RRM domain-containing protein n=1 Tax=Paramecium pentaurelia TaxID=43138 RepID=A0A8S1YFI2_9CILI|nr:unnamed protein product [Paramecium pentaurelia]
MQWKEINLQLLPRTSPQSSRIIILIETLDQYFCLLYFRRLNIKQIQVVGEIQSLKIIKDMASQKSKGQAFITYNHPDSNKKASKNYNQIFIKSESRVNIFVDNLPESSYAIEKIIKVNYDIPNQSHQEIAEIKIIQSLYLVKVESNLRNYATPLQQKYLEQEKLVRVIKYWWFLMIKDFLQKSGFSEELYCKGTKYKIAFYQNHIRNTRSSKNKFEYFAHHTLEQINKHRPSVINDASETLSISEITQVLKEKAQVHTSTLK